MTLYIYIYLYLSISLSLSIAISRDHDTISSLPNYFKTGQNCEFGDLKTSPLAIGDGPRNAKMWVMLNFDIIHHKIKIWIHLNTTSFIGRENIRKQHQHRARPSDMHIPRNTPGPRLHQRQSEVRAVVASHHGLGGRVLPMKGPNGIRVLQRHFWVLFGACSLHSCWTCLECIAEELAIKCLWRTQISKIIGKNTHVQPMWMCGWMTVLDFRTHACINPCLHMYICEDESI